MTRPSRGVSVAANGHPAKGTSAVSESSLHFTSKWLGERRPTGSSAPRRTARLHRPLAEQRPDSALRRTPGQRPRRAVARRAGAGTRHLQPRGPGARRCRRHPRHVHRRQGRLARGADPLLPRPDRSSRAEIRRRWARERGDRHRGRARPRRLRRPQEPHAHSTAGRAPSRPQPELTLRALPASLPS